ncbi:MAG: cytochrome c553 [Paraglaciecola sp.]|jgi:cytochrome c553
MKLLLLILLTTSLYSPLTLAANSPSGLPNCVVCHGSGLQGNIVIQAPNLSILPAWYITAQLQAYLHHWRGADVSLTDAKGMRAVALALTDKERQQALKYIGAMAPQSSQPNIGGDTSHGKQLFTRCSACHGDMAQGNEALKAPPLAGQNDWYIVSQLKAYQAKHRGYVKEDSNGNIMLSSMDLLDNEQDILDVALYLNSIKISKD